jgi:ATP-binding cassette subfamily C protein
VLALTGSFYMLQIYDRALASGSIPTLVALSILAIGLYLSQGVFDIIRAGAGASAPSSTGSCRQLPIA